MDVKNQLMTATSFIENKGKLGLGALPKSHSHSTTAREEPKTDLLERIKTKSVLLISSLILYG